MASGRPSSRRQILPDDAPAGVVGLEGVGDEPGPVDEQLDRGLRGQRRQRPDLLARQPQRHPAGGQDPDRRAPPDEVTGQFRDRLDHVLAVVEDQRQLAVGQRVGQRCRHRSAGLLAHAERHPDRPAVNAGVGQRRQLGEPHPVPEPGPQPRSHLDAQPGPATARRAGDGHQAGVREGVLQLRPLGLTAEEPRELRGQVQRTARCLAGAVAFPAWRPASRSALSRSTKPLSRAPLRSGRSGGTAPDGRRSSAGAVSRDSSRRGR
jgi:hypothetical protein